MSLTNAIAILKRQDAQVKVNVPASGHHKAYSYYKEGSGKGGAIVRGVALGVGGTLAGGALTAALLARKKAKNGDDVIDVESREMSNAITGDRMKSALSQGKAPMSRSGTALVTPPPMNSSDRVLVTPNPKRPFKSKAFDPDPEVMDKRMEEARSQMSPRNLAMLEARQARESRGSNGFRPKIRNEGQIRNALEKRKAAFGDEYTERDVQAQLAGSKAKRDKRNAKIAPRINEIINERSLSQNPSKASATPQKSISQMVKEGVGTSSTSKQNAVLSSDKSENLFTKGIKSLRKVKNAEAKTSEQEGSQPKNQSAYPPKRQGIVDKGFAAIRNMVKEGGDRHNKAVKSLSEKEIDLNKASYTAGEKTRIAAHNTATFAKAYAQTFGKKQPQTIDVKASEVKEPPESLTLSKQSQSKKKSKRNAPTAAKKRSTQKQLDDLNK